MVRSPAVHLVARTHGTREVPAGINIPERVSAVDREWIRIQIWIPRQIQIRILLPIVFELERRQRPLRSFSLEPFFSKNILFRCGNKFTSEREVCLIFTLFVKDLMKTHGVDVGICFALFSSAAAVVPLASLKFHCSTVVLAVSGGTSRAGGVNVAVYNTLSLTRTQAISPSNVLSPAERLPIIKFPAASDEIAPDLFCVES